MGAAPVIHKNRVPDTYLPSTSNFAAGWPAEARKPFNREKIYMDQQLAEGCHLAEDTEGHCPGGATYYY